MTGGTKGGAQRASSLRPRCFGEVDTETATHICLSTYNYYPFLNTAYTRSVHSAVKMLDSKRVLGHQ
jgi:hypothetical protein